MTFSIKNREGWNIIKMKADMYVEKCSVCGNWERLCNLKISGKQGLENQDWKLKVNSLS